MSGGIGVRLDAETKAQVDRMAQQYGWTTSQTLRYLIDRGLGMDATDAIIRQEKWRVHEAVKLAAAEINEMIQDAIERNLTKVTQNVAGAGRRRRGRRGGRGK